MAIPIKKSASPPPAPKPQPAIAPEKRASAASAMGNEAHHKKYLRPFLYLWKFTTGTLNAGLDDMAKGANKGMWLGVGLVFLLGATGLVTFGAGSLFVPMLMGAATGFFGGAALGGAAGLLTGGIQNVMRQHRAEKYADDLLVKETVKSMPIGKSMDYRSAYQANQQKNYMIDRLLQQQRELRQETWQERIGNEHGGHGFHGHGGGW